MVKKVGEHVTLDIIGTKKEYEPSFFENLVQKIADKAKVTVLNISKYKFEPQGFTLVALLAESHMSFHTFPEKGIISFDIYTCGIISPTVALDIIKKEIAFYLQAGSHSTANSMTHAFHEISNWINDDKQKFNNCLLYTSPSPRDS